MSTSGNSDADVDASELVEADNQEGFVDLEPQDLGLDQVERLSVDLNQSLTSLISFLSVSYAPVYSVIVSTLQWATAVAIHNSVSQGPPQHEQRGSIPVFFLPKHCTLWVVDAIFAIGVDRVFRMR